MPSRSMCLHVIQRQQAKKSGLKSYFTGEPCCRGHVSERFTGKGTCKACMREDYVANVDRKKEYDKARCDKIRDVLRAARKTHYEKNKERHNQQVKAWCKKHPERRRAICKAYKARRRAWELSGDTTAKIYSWEKSVPKFCHWCGIDCRSYYEIDHYHPLSKGGKHDVANLVISCKKCNQRKAAKDPYEFANSLGRLF